MGRNKTPTAILDAKGAFIANPQRKRPDEPKGRNPLGNPPSFLKLTAEEKQVWRQLLKRIPPGVAFESDEIMFATFVRLTTRWIATGKEGVLPLKASEESLRLSIASRFAMTPADRSRVSVEKPKESGLKAFLNRRNAQPATTAIQ